MDTIPASTPWADTRQDIFSDLSAFADVVVFFFAAPIFPASAGSFTSAIGRIVAFTHAAIFCRFGFGGGIVKCADHLATKRTERADAVVSMFFFTTPIFLANLRRFATNAIARKIAFFETTLACRFAFGGGIVKCADVSTARAIRLYGLGGGVPFALRHK